MQNIFVIFLILIGLLISEYIGDFILQSRKTAVEKSTNIMILSSHILDIIWSLVFYFIVISFMIKIPISGTIFFILLYSLIHGIQDWYLWKFFKIFKAKKLKKEVEQRISEIGLNKEKTFENMFKNRVDKYYQTKEYAVDRIYYNAIGLDRLLHIITLLILFKIFIIK